MSFRAPVRDIAFSLTAAAEIGRLAETGAFPDFDAETMDAVLEAAGQLATEVLAPLNRTGDLKGALYANGKVTAAPGFRDAYQAFAAGGWASLGADPEYGGQGLPKALEQGAFEMIHAANMAFGLCPMLSQGAIEALHEHGTPEQKALYLPKLISGEWTGTMNLTEPQSGSDLSTLRTVARPNGDGTYALEGQKIYITWGDHDVADNIVHFVLARLPDAPEGTKGISLFLAPKFLPDAAGNPGEPNAVRPVGIEHKLGINASPTCVMSFEGARAWLVGQVNQGLAHMFTMMNAARLSVGVEGVGVAERAFQQALAYALDRRQGRSPATGQPNAPIFEHPDVRRMLTLSKAKIEAARGICFSTAVAADLARHTADPEAAARWKRREDLLVPIAKAWSTDVGVEVASTGVQVHGGMGFVEETGAAQHYRDARIAPIYEGTNGIQAIDLVGRKLSMAGGAAVAELIEDAGPTLDALTASSDPRIAAGAARLSEAFRAVRSATDWLLEKKSSAQLDVLAGAYPYLRLLGDAIGGLMLGRQALEAERRKAAGEGDAAWLDARTALFALYGEHVLAEAPGRVAAVAAGADVLTSIGAEALAA